MFPILVMLFTVIPAIEIYLLFSIGGQIGGGNTFLLVLITGVIGAALAKSQGAALLAKIQGELSQGRVPANSFIHGLLVFGGGLLLLTPGFLTDVLGLSMVLPLTRHLWLIYLKKFFMSSIESGNVQFYSFKNGGGFSSYSGNAYNAQARHEGTKNGPIQIDENTFEVDYEKK
ncbi:FxsA family protein [Halobacteriovorax sp. XZX-3]|uniref:FxsA family protein n=1 Tax=unclassified Halobacteriovorax TaxID=2639665 RepID=UPI000CD12939|nr:FxsA family protein [Halobacteriovorax sp. DA5]POB14980.1 hypothetical protein C0Z22_00975 [Halobacteriovorax sp. DA5]